METSDRVEFAKAMTVVAELYDKHISPTRIAAFFNVLEPYPQLDLAIMIANQRLILQTFFV